MDPNVEVSCVSASCVVNDWMLSNPLDIFVGFLFEVTVVENFHNCRYAFLETDVCLLKVTNVSVNAPCHIVVRHEVNVLYEDGV